VLTVSRSFPTISSPSAAKGGAGRCLIRQHAPTAAVTSDEATSTPNPRASALIPGIT